MTLRGWQRTWLGTAEAVEVAFSPSQIRNAVRRDSTVRFEVRIGRRWRNVEFTVPDGATAEQLLGALPATRTAGFEEAWVGLQEFNRVMAAQEGRYWVTPALVVMNLAAFVAIVVRSGGTYVDPQEMARWANAGLVTTRGEWWRLLTATFLHWNLAHVALNMWALWNAGRLTERLYGSTTFLAMYLASGILGSLASIAWNPTVVSAGASGAVFGVLGALLACTLREHGLPRVVVKAHRWSTLTFVVLNLALGAISPNIDNAAHLGGLAAGLVLGWLLARPIRLDRRADLTGAQVAVAASIVAVTLGLRCLFHAGAGPACRRPIHVGGAERVVRRGRSPSLPPCDRTGLEAELRSDQSRRIRGLRSARTCCHSCSSPSRGWSARPWRNRTRRPSAFTRSRPSSYSCVATGSPQSRPRSTARRMRTRRKPRASGTPSRTRSRASTLRRSVRSSTAGRWACGPGCSTHTGPESIPTLRTVCLPRKCCAGWQTRRTRRATARRDAARPAARRSGRSYTATTRDSNVVSPLHGPCSATCPTVRPPTRASWAASPT